MWLATRNKLREEMSMCTREFAAKAEAVFVLANLLRDYSLTGLIGPESVGLDMILFTQHHDVRK